MFQRVKMSDRGMEATEGRHSAAGTAVKSSHQLELQVLIEQ